MDGLIRTRARNEIIYHEYVSLFPEPADMASSRCGSMKGLAEFYSTFESSEDNIDVGKPVSRHVHI
jgi:hypothetical protein